MAGTAGQRLILAALLGVGVVWLGGLYPVAAAPAVAAAESLGPGVQVDWNRGVLLAAGSCAADLFAASAEVARVKAERLARSRAQARLHRALQTLSREPRLRGKLSPELLGQLDPTHAKVVHIEYAATGSVSVRLELALTAKAGAVTPGPAAVPPVADAARDGGPTTTAEEEKSP